MATNATNARRAKEYDFGTIPCEDCGKTVKKTGTRTKLCGGCKKERKREADRLYHLANVERIRERARRWEKRNPEKVRASYLRRKAAGRERESDRRKYQQHGEKIRERARIWYQNNREKVLARGKTPEGREAARRREMKKRECPHYKMHTAISGHVRNAIRDKGGRQVFDLLPYSRDDLIAHLERQFAKGMSWDNYSRHGWHIDHIVPRSAFSYTSADDPDFQACWALTNLRPMWAKANISKHASREFLL